MNCKTSGIISFRWRRPKWRALVEMSIMILVVWANGPGHLAVTEVKSSECPGHLESMIPNTAASLHQDGWKRKEPRCCNGPVKVQTSRWNKSYALTFRKLCINKCLQTSMNWRDTGWWYVVCCLLSEVVFTSFHDLMRSSVRFSSGNSQIYNRSGLD